MGNFCSAARYVLHYTVEYILPMFRPYIPSGYEYMIEENFASREDVSDFLERSFPNVDELNTLESQNFDNVETSANNFIFLLGVIKDFFKNYHFQTNVLSGKVFERNLINSENNYPNLRTDTFRLKKLKWNFRRNDFVPDVEQITIEDTNNSPNCEENVGFRYIYDQDQESNLEEQGEIEYVVKERTTVKSNKSNSRDQRRKYGAVKEENLAKRGKFQQNFSNCRSIVERKNFANQISDGIRRRLVSGRKPTSLSLPNLNSGCYFLEEESNENVKLANYSSESIPIRAHIENFRQYSHPNLFSGGRVSSEELSEHLSIPDYYSENPITYKELPEGFEFTKSLPVEIPSEQITLQPTSCSGGGIVPDKSKRVSLPDLFPEANPLLRSVSMQVNTRSSMSFGQLVMTEEDQKVIFSDLLFQSRQWDEKLLKEAVEREDPNQAS